MANGTLAASQIEMLSQSGTGITTIVPPATNTNRTLTLPDSTGTVATNEAIAAAGYTTSAGVLTQFNASGSAPVFACRAWVNFNGSGTIAIRASGNVSSITDNGLGNYTINFATAMPDANYSMVGTTELTDGYGEILAIGNATATSNTTTTCQIRARVTGVAYYDGAVTNVAFFR